MSGDAERGVWHSTVDRATDSRGRRLIELIPIVGWLPHHDRRWLSSDALAGLTL